MIPWWLYTRVYALSVPLVLATYQPMPVNDGAPCSSHIHQGINYKGYSSMRCNQSYKLLRTLLQRQLAAHRPFNQPLNRFINRQTIWRQSKLSGKAAEDLGWRSSLAFAL